MTKRTQFVLGSILSLALLGGCATSIAYKPIAAPAPPAAAGVALVVKDQRPADKGGSDKSQVGVERGKYGIPSSLKDGDPNVVTRTVSEATTDALRQAAVDVKAGSSKTVVATVQHYWMDGMVGYKGTVLVNFALQDPRGKTLWAADVTGASGGTTLFKGGPKLANDVFQSALGDLATRAAERFRSDAFKQALR